MRIKAPISFFKSAIPQPLPEAFTQSIRYESDTTVIALALHEYPDETIKAIRLAASKSPVKTIQALTRKIDDYYNLAANPTAEGIGKLERLVVVLTAYIRKSPHKIVFQDSNDEAVLPWYASSVHYVPRDKRNGVQAHVRLDLTAIRRGERLSNVVRWYSEDLRGSPKVHRLLFAGGLYLETPEAYEQWLKELEYWRSIRDLRGVLFTGEGTGWQGEALVRDGVPAKLVMDDDCSNKEDSEADGRGTSSGSCSAAFWQLAQLKAEADGEEAGEDTEDESEDTNSIALPIHPYVQVFDLEKHRFAMVHACNLTRYVYRTDLGDKLVLPDEHRELIDILVQGAADMMEDIVSGKTGGVVVACTGVPGTGKTLTAEVCSETIKAPLYTVQCSQLGTDEEALEQRLQKVLRRAGRWGAILLIDEADVYVRTRGNDITQNAIVGVFLRLLERYRGVLFLTSNLGTQIDDAIMSRCIAHVKYGAPNTDELTKLWNILSANYGVTLSAKDVTTLVATYPGISGRNVKNLLKLAVMVAKRKNTQVTANVIKSISSFVELLKS